MLDDSTDTTKRAGNSSQHLAITPDALARTAQRVADGQMDIPEGLSDDDAAKLVAEVQKRRRARLVKFIAARIAAEIRRDGEAKGRRPTP